MYRSILSTALFFSFSTSSYAALDLFQPENNKTDNLVWVGHLSPDTDSVVSAMLASHIYGGKATTSEAINPESQFVLNYCNLEAPQVMNDYSTSRIGLVDFNQRTQLAPSINTESIVAVIDHHAIGGAPINTPQLVTMDIRAWGSAATILVSNANMLNVALPKPLACAALGAILSDTVVLQSSTTTSYDKHYVQELAKTAQINDIKDFGQQMLIAKSDLSHFSADEILMMDYKNFEFNGQKVGIGVAETLTAQQLIARKDELLKAMNAHKKQHNLDQLFFSITDTKNKQANILWSSSSEKHILERAFDTSIDKEEMLTLKGVTSRKRQIGPAISKAMDSAL